MATYQEIYVANVIHHFLYNTLFGGRLKVFLILLGSFKLERSILWVLFEHTRPTSLALVFEVCEVRALAH